MPYHTPEDKAERAFELLFTEIEEYELAGLSICRAFSSSDRREPSLEIECVECEPDPQRESAADVGNWTCGMTFRVRTHYDPRRSDAARTEHANWIGEVRDRLRTATLVADLNTATVDEDFTAIGVWIGASRRMVDGHSMITEQTARLLMMPSRA